MNKGQLTYSDVARSELFRKLMEKKRKFIVPVSLFFLAFYFTLPVLTSYFEVLNRPAFGPVSWAWVFAFAQFIMTWGLCYMYTRKSVEFDELCEQIKNQVQHKEQKAG